MLKKTRKKYRPARPRTAYTLGTDVCFSKLLRAGYFDSWTDSVLAADKECEQCRKIRRW